MTEGIIHIVYKFTVGTFKEWSQVQK